MTCGEVLYISHCTSVIGDRLYVDVDAVRSFHVLVVSVWRDREGGDGCVPWKGVGRGWGVSPMHM